MTYFEGFIAPVPEANRDAYVKHASEFGSLSPEFGIKRHVEAWDDDVPEGKVTDFRKAVDATPDEKVVFAWFEYADKDARTAANEKMMNDPRTKEMSSAQMPFDTKRMIYGGFKAIVEEGTEHGGYTDGFVVPVIDSKREAYREMASKMAKVFREHGANRVVETIADDVPHGKVTDFYRAVKAEDGETVAFSFIEWPDKQTRDQAWAKIMEDESMRPQGELPFVGQRMFWGGFEPVVDTASAKATENA